jgi:hypothetical protein
MLSHNHHLSGLKMVAKNIRHGISDIEMTSQITEKEIYPWITHP